MMVSGVAIALDISAWYNERAPMQSAVDAAALMVVREFSVGGQDTRRVAEVARQLTLAKLGLLAEGSWATSIVDWQRSTLAIRIDRDFPSRFAGIVGLAEADIAASAQAGSWLAAHLPYRTRAEEG